jgi:dolichol kinase
MILLKSVRQKQKAKNNENSFGELTSCEEPLNLIGMFLILLLMAVIIYIKVSFEMKGTFADLPALVMAYVPVGTLAIALVWNGIQKLRGVRKVRRWGLKSETNQLSDKDKRKIDRQRKFFHFLVFGLILGALSMGDYVLEGLIAGPNGAAYQIVSANFWGQKNGLNYIQDLFAVKENSLGYLIIFLWMFGQSIVLLTLEITRLSDNVQFPFQKQIQATLRFKEIDTFASYTHFTIGYLFAAMVLPPTLFLATLCLITFADPMASTIGINFGKHRYSWNKKSVEGTIAGFLAALLSMVFFVGWVYAICGAICFMLLDLFTPEPIKMSDNLAMPIMTTLLFIVLSILGIPAMNFLGF